MEYICCSSSKLYEAASAGKAEEAARMATLELEAALAKKYAEGERKKKERKLAAKAKAEGHLVKKTPAEKEEDEEVIYFYSVFIFDCFIYFILFLSLHSVLLINMS